MVGDRLDTDILFGQANGTSDMLVLPGECLGPAEAPSLPPSEISAPE